MPISGRSNLDTEQPDVLLRSISSLFKFLPGEQKQAFARALGIIGRKCTYQHYKRKHKLEIVKAPWWD